MNSEDDYIHITDNEYLADIDRGLSSLNATSQDQATNTSLAYDSLHRIETLLSETINDRTIRYKLEDYQKSIDELLTSSEKQIEKLQNINHNVWELSSKLDSISGNTHLREKHLIDRLFTIIICVLLGLIFLVLLYK